MFDRRVLQLFSLGVFVFITTFGSLALIVIHLWYNGISVGWITIALLVISATPYVIPLVKSVDVPGVARVELRDVRKAASKITTGRQNDGDLKRKDNEEAKSLRRLSKSDPSVALVGFRIDLEDKLMDLADQNNINTTEKDIPSILRNLSKKGVISEGVIGGVQELIYLGNRAARGEEVAPSAAEWVSNNASDILSSLDDEIDA